MPKQPVNGAVEPMPTPEPAPVVEEPQTEAAPMTLTEDLTILELAEEATKQRVAAGGKPINESQVRTALKAFEGFKAEGAVQTKPIKGTKIEVIYIRPEAAQAWIDSLSSKASQGVERNAGAGIVYRIRVKQEHFEAAQAALAAIDPALKLERAFKPKAPSDTPEAAEGIAAEMKAQADAGTAQISIDDLFQPEATVNA